jgi:hypothetical protein
VERAGFARRAGFGCGATTVTVGNSDCACPAPGPPIDNATTLTVARQRLFAFILNIVVAPLHRSARACSLFSNSSFFCV